MGVDYERGDMPFCIECSEAFVEEAQDHFESNQPEGSYQIKGFAQQMKTFCESDLAFRNGWTIKHSGLDIDHISMEKTFKKGELVVYLANLDYYNDGQSVFVSKDELSLTEFVKDFNVEGKIDKNCRVTQIC